MTEWRLYANPFTHPLSDFPHTHEWIEIRRQDEPTGRVVRYADLHPAMNVWGLWWRPAKAPETRNDATV